jgi:hypothetical protein
MGGYATQTPHPEAPLSAFLKVMRWKRAELGKGWVGQRLSLWNIGLSWEKDGLSWSRTKLR